LFEKKNFSASLPEEACGALASGAVTDRPGYVEDSLMSPSRNPLKSDDLLFTVYEQTCPAGAFFFWRESGCDHMHHLACFPQVNMRDTPQLRVLRKHFEEF